MQETVFWVKMHGLIGTAFATTNLTKTLVDYV